MYSTEIYLFIMTLVHHQTASFTYIVYVDIILPCKPNLWDPPGLCLLQSKTQTFYE